MSMNRLEKLIALAQPLNEFHQELERITHEGKVLRHQYEYLLYQAHAELLLIKSENESLRYERDRYQKMIDHLYNKMVIANSVMKPDGTILFRINTFSSEESRQLWEKEWGLDELK